MRPRYVSFPSPLPPLLILLLVHPFIHPLTRPSLPPSLPPSLLQILYPNVPIEAVVSFGTGNVLESQPVEGFGWAPIFNQLINR